MKKPLPLKVVKKEAKPFVFKGLASSHCTHLIFSYVDFAHEV